MSAEILPFQQTACMLCGDQQRERYLSAKRLPARWLLLSSRAVLQPEWPLFQPWADSNIGRRPEDYREFVYREVCTPLSTLAFTGAEHGAVYGLEASPGRFMSGSLRAKTPMPGLYLAGQDVTSMRITGAMMRGVITAAAVEPAVFRHVR